MLRWHWSTAGSRPTERRLRRRRKTLSVFFHERSSVQTRTRCSLNKPNDDRDPWRPSVSELTLSIAQAIIAETIAHARNLKLKPLAVVVLDARGAVELAATERPCDATRLPMPRHMAR